ncbi:hypothetical protein POPTR_014G192400v4 [Populus trichocarpa]|uniref:Uncharacterized protein n=1 Tax=Populus trichocarpa TaxID=3694 RepID=U5FQI5_POPTR|nr:hypothetical protein BDE02_14G161500 [Populus trichocarpa]PNT05751.1 hypothetical protein POPTR_014G192400v4 [Populus trichocarpa]
MEQLLPSCFQLEINGKDVKNGLLLLSSGCKEQQGIGGIKILKAACCASRFYRPSLNVRMRHPCDSGAFTSYVSHTQG